MTRKRKTNESLLRRITRIAGLILKVLEYFQKKTIPLGFLVIAVFIFSISLTIIIIVNSGPSEDLPTPFPASDVKPQGQLKNSNELDSEEPKDIQKGAESGTQRTENGSLSKDLKDIGKRVESGTQHMEDMRKSVKAMNEDVKKMTEKAKKMKEELDGGSED